MNSFMDAAFVEARKALAIGEVPVGCVFVYNGEIIARGSNDVNATKNATRHAELMCIDRLLVYCTKHDLNYKDVLPNVSVFVTVEPCIMCASLLYDVRVREIIYGCSNDRFGGTTLINFEEIMGNSIPITAGVRGDEAMELLKTFYKGENPSAPVPKTKN